MLLGMAIFGIGIGLAMVGNTNMISGVCSKENFGSAMVVNQMILMMDMSAGPVIAGLIIGGFADASTGYACCWGMAALLALLAIAFVLLNKTDWGIESVSPALRGKNIRRWMPSRDGLPRDHLEDVRVLT